MKSVRSRIIMIIMSLFVSLYVRTGIYLDFMTRGIIAMLWGSRPNPFCECAIIGLLIVFYIVMCDINMKTTVLTRCTRLLFYLCSKLTVAR